MDGTNRKNWMRRDRIVAWIACALVCGAVVGDSRAIGRPDVGAVRNEEPKKRAKPGDDAKPKPSTDEESGIAFEDRIALRDSSKRYFLHGPKTKDAKAPKSGWRLVLVLPGGDGSAEFRAFVTRMLANAGEDDVLFAQLVAPVWGEGQGDKIVWPTKRSPFKGMKFTTEEFVDAVLADVAKTHAIDPKRIDALAWSSSGQAVYTATLLADSRIRGAFVAMSVFKPDELPSLDGAKGKPIFLLHSPEDFIAMRFPEAARDELGKAGARVELVTYEGGHGWKGDVYGNLRKGLAWLDAPAAKDKGRAAK